MNNYWIYLRKLAKSIRYQNIFLATKEQSGIQLFKNISEFTEIQEIFLSLLYTYDLINKDIMIDNISKKTIENDLYTDSYMIWRNKNKNKKETKDIVDSSKGVKLTKGNSIKFPKRI
jgi:hypothetical protein